MNLQAASWALRTILIAVVGLPMAGAQTAPSKAPTRPAAIVLPVQGPIEWKLSVETFEKTLKMACVQKPQVLVLQISSPGGVVDYTWNMISMFKGLRDPQTVAWVNGEHNGGVLLRGDLCTGLRQDLHCPGAGNRGIRPVRNGQQRRSP